MSKTEQWQEQASSFHFEALGTPIPIMAAEWAGDNPLEARIFFHNEKFLESFGDHRGRLLMDLFDEVTMNNASEGRFLGYTLFEELLDKGSLQMIHGTLADKRVELFAKLQTSNPQRIQFSVFDITERMHDHITGLPGRELFFDRLSISLYKATRSREALTLLYLDLDGFKKANDLYGHKTGDGILVEVAKRLRTMLRRHETAARIGGDEFAIVLSGTSAREGLRFAEEKVIPALNLPYESNGHSVDFVGVSIGIASFPHHSTQTDELLSLADQAMYLAKNSGKNRAVIY